jgi:hypothetical protein
VRKQRQGAMGVSPTAPSRRLDITVRGIMAVNMNSLPSVSPAQIEHFLVNDGNSQDQGFSGSDTGVDTPVSATSGMEVSGLRRSP